MSSPLIRYENGDRGKYLAEKCSCGVNLPLMAPVKGREVERFELPNGTMLSGEFLTTLFDDYPEAVKRFQVVYEKDGSIVLRIIPNHQFPALEDTLATVKERLLVRVDHEVKIQIERVSQLEDDRGKLRYIINHNRS